jgi:EpsI family protein
LIKPGKISPFWAWGIAIIVVILSGIGYRVLASHLKVVIANPVDLPVPLSAFPSQIDDWVGKDLPIPNTTREYMESHFADDFLSRRYINTANNAWVDVYIVYCSSQPGGMLGHQPRVCYPGNGWIHDGTEQSQFTSRTSLQIPCLIHQFHKPTPTYDHTVVLNFYILNGKIITEERDFSGLLGRRLNIAGNPARYVAQVQISSVLENSIRQAAKDMTDWILDFFPDENGKVRATEANAHR